MHDLSSKRHVDDALRSVAMGLFPGLKIVVNPLYSVHNVRGRSLSSPIQHFHWYDGCTWKFLPPADKSLVKQTKTPPKKLREGNIFTGTCHSVHGGGGRTVPAGTIPHPPRPPPPRWTRGRYASYWNVFLLKITHGQDFNIHWTCPHPFCGLSLGLPCRYRKNPLSLCNIVRIAIGIWDKISQLFYVSGKIIDLYLSLHRTFYQR